MAGWQIHETKNSIVPRRTPHCCQPGHIIRQSQKLCPHVQTTLISKRHKKRLHRFPHEDIPLDSATWVFLKIRTGHQGVYVQFYKFLRLGKAGYAAQAEETHCQIVGQLKPSTKMEIGHFTILYLAGGLEHFLFFPIYWE
jgi:hypothetical protein